MYYRLRAWFATLSILFNQTVHLGMAPYPYTFSETCYLRQHLLRYRVCRFTIDFVFSLLDMLASISHGISMTFCVVVSLFCDVYG